MRIRALVYLCALLVSGCGGDSEAGGGGSGGSGATDTTAGSGGASTGPGGTSQAGGVSGSGGSGALDASAESIDAATPEGSTRDHSPTPSSFAVVTNRYDNDRTGANTQEPFLTTSNVRAGQFGLLFSRLYDGNAYAQPLYVPGLAIGGGTHDVVYVATSTNNVYAFDATDPAVAAPYWSKQVAPVGQVAIDSTLPTPRPNGYTWCKDMYPFSGITGTPVIDLPNQRMFLVSQEGMLNQTYTLKLHALDLVTGNELGGGPSVITATVDGTGDGSVGGKLTLDSWRQFNRAGLTLYNGTLYVAMTSHCDENPYHGWFFAYDPDTLTQKSVFNTTPNSNRGAIWQSGVGVAVNARGLFYSTGNGGFASNGSALSLSVVRMNLDNTLADWFTPYNASSLNSSDADLTGGVLLIPNSNYLVSGGKEGVVYLIDQTNMTHFNASVDGGASDNIAQRVSLGKADIHDFVYYRNRVYVWPDNKVLSVFPFVNNRLDTGSVQTYAGRTPPHPGGIMTISSDGETDGSAILWATIVTSGDAWHNIAYGALLALDAMNPSILLWDSTMNLADNLGNLAKFSPPTVANGRVYVATFANVLATSPSYLRVYGLKN